VPILSVHHVAPVVVLYIGPDQIMPLTSFLGAALGVALMFWNRLVQAVRRAATIVMRRNQTDAGDSQSLNVRSVNSER